MRRWLVKDPEPESTSFSHARALLQVSGYGALLAFVGYRYWRWFAEAPLSPEDVARGRTLARILLAIGAALAVVAGVSLVRVIRRRADVSARTWIGRALSVSVGLALILAIGAVVHSRRWKLRLRNVPSAVSLPVDSAGYDVQKLPFRFCASFARGHDVYLADPFGVVSRTRDDDPQQRLQKLGETGPLPRLLFVSSKGSLFMSRNDSRLLRSTDNGRTWKSCLDQSIWRMDEDSRTGVLYAGNYPPRKGPGKVATVFRSADGGDSWQEIFYEPLLDHVHTVRRDPTRRRVLISLGDGPVRGQMYSDDEGVTWQPLMRGPKQGHTDAALSDRFVLWGSDDSLGRVLRAPRRGNHSGVNVLWCGGHHVWSVVASGRQVYAATFTGVGAGKEGCYLLASTDEGNTWQKIMAHRSNGELDSAFVGDSRQLSAEGWLYIADEESQGYRVRKTPDSRTER